MDLLPLIKLISSFLFFILLAVFLWLVSKRKPPTVLYLLDFVCYKPPFSKPDPKMVLENQPELYSSPNEVENVAYETVDELLNKTKQNFKNIGVLICMFNGPSEISVSSMIMKKYKLKEDIASYDLNGKGCNYGIMGITLTKQLLQVKHDSLALVLMTEELPENRHVITETDSSPSVYRRSGTAVLLSNRPSDSFSSKLKLIGTHNVHVAVSQDATSASERVVKSNVAFVSSRISRCRKCYSLCQASGEPMVGVVERELNREWYSLEESRLVRSWFGYEPVSSLWYRFGDWEASGWKIEKGERLSFMVFWSDWSQVKGSSLVWEAMGDVGFRQDKIEPIIIKLFNRFNLRQFGLAS